LGDKSTRHRGRLPPVVSSLFSVKAAHWRDGIRGTELGARGKERTARQRRVIRVKGSASRGEASSMSMKRKRERRTRILNVEATFELLVIGYRMYGRAASAQGYGRARHACLYRFQIKPRTKALGTSASTTLICPQVADPASSSRRSTARQGGLFYYSNGPKIC
jgi:hypothetical protein